MSGSTGTQEGNQNTRSKGEEEVQGISNQKTRTMTPSAYVNMWTLHLLEIITCIAVNLEH